MHWAQMKMHKIRPPLPEFNQKAIDDAEWHGYARKPRYREIENEWGSGHCGAIGPGGECIRAYGHTDTNFGWQNKAKYGNVHVSYDSDHYEEWPVGWRDAEFHVRSLHTWLEEQLKLYRNGENIRVDDTIDAVIQQIDEILEQL